MPVTERERDVGDGERDSRSPVNERGGYRESERWCEWERVAG